MNRVEMLKEADRLTREQRKARGTKTWLGLDHKPTVAPGDYVDSPENRQRAATILYLRRRAARLPR